MKALRAGASSLLAVIILAGVQLIAAPHASAADQGRSAVRPAADALGQASAAQLPLKDAADLVNGVAAQVPGFAGIVIEPDRVVVHLKGAVPLLLEGVLGAARKIAPVVVAPARNSARELQTASDVIMAYIRTHPRSPFYGVATKSDGRGVTISQDPRFGSDALALPSDLAIPAGVDAVVAVEERPTFSGRMDDSPPYYGGGNMLNVEVPYRCTAGFAVKNSDFNSVYYGTYMLTAGHCGRAGGGFNNGNNSRPFGTGKFEDAPSELLLVSASVGGRIWDGGSYGTNNFAKPVKSQRQVYTGTYECTSGVTSGARCYFRVTDTSGYSYCGEEVYGNTECFYGLVIAAATDGGPGSRGGDSGGPVFSLNSDASQVFAEGIISGYRGSSELLFATLSKATSKFNVTAISGV